MFTVLLLAASVVLHLPPALPKTGEPVEVWISRTRGSHYSSADFAGSKPLAKVFVPFLQSAPALGTTAIAADQYLKTENALADDLHSKGILVYGVVTPFVIDSISAKGFSSDLHEVKLNDVDRTVEPKFLTPFSDDLLDRFFKNLDRSCALGKVDGLVLDILFPEEELYGYGRTTRDYFIEHERLDPIDFDYPVYAHPRAGTFKKEAVAKISAERSERAEFVLTRFLEFCDQRHLKAVLMGSLNAYNLSPTARAAMMSDWAVALVKHPSLSCVLTSSTRENIAQLIDLARRSLTISGIPASRLSFLVDDVSVKAGSAHVIQRIP